ncbi:nitroreductase family protein [Cohnella cellulosilytica]|uniref:Nitroreductase n=1 Tax=Cohnella cellulosilytica TaxID=986710 RepID=A0ABW2FL58_9BACL
MSTLSLFRETQEVRRFADRPVEREFILSILDDAVWAPNHKLREPWRFVYAEGAAKLRLADAVDARQHPRLVETLAQAPVALVVTSPINKDERTDSDDFGAVCCLIQNIQLLGWAQGLGMSWELADYSGCEELRALAGVRDDERIAGILGLGFFDSLPEKPPVVPLDDRLEIW